MAQTSFGLSNSPVKLRMSSPSRHSDKAALRGEPGYVWRSGQERRLRMIQQWINLNDAVILDNGCGLGTYLEAFAPFTPHRFGLELELDRAQKALARRPRHCAGDGGNAAVCQREL
jgi:hypothetical protein